MKPPCSSWFVLAPPGRQAARPPSSDVRRARNPALHTTPTPHPHCTHRMRCMKWYSSSADVAVSPLDRFCMSLAISATVSCGGGAGHGGG